jgi:hypothetical protein
MIIKEINGIEHFECSNCGTETFEDAEVCQVCGKTFDDTKKEAELSETTDEQETMCIVVGANYSGKFVFTQLKIDITPKHMIDQEFMADRRMMKEANPYEFYVFQSSLHPNLSQGVQVNIELGKYDYFVTSNYVQVRYNKEQFSDSDVTQLKSFKFHP